MHVKLVVNERERESFLSLKFTNFKMKFLVFVTDQVDSLCLPSLQRPRSRVQFKDEPLLVTLLYILEILLVTT